MAVVLSELQQLRAVGFTGSATGGTAIATALASHPPADPMAPVTQAAPGDALAPGLAALGAPSPLPQTRPAPTATAPTLPTTNSLYAAGLSGGFPGFPPGLPPAPHLPLRAPCAPGAARPCVPLQGLLMFVPAIHAASAPDVAIRSLDGADGSFLIQRIADAVEDQLPLVIVTGVLAEGSFRACLANLDIAIDRARLHSPGFGRFEPTDSPMDWSAGAARLNDVLRASKAFSSTTVATAPTAGTAGVMSADEKLSYKQHAASIPSLGNSPSAVDLRRAASGALVGELATIQSVLASRGFPLSGNEATDVQLAVSIFGKAALAVVCSCGKVDSRVQGEIPALILSLRSRLVTSVANTIIGFLGSIKARDEGL